MTKKRNVVTVWIAYKQEGNCRSTVCHEIRMLSEINRLLDQHRELMDHTDPVKPVVTQVDNDQGSYSCKLTLQFNTKSKYGKAFQYARLHHLLKELGALLALFEAGFEQLESYIDIAGMKQPWVQVAGPVQVLLRKGAAHWNAVGLDIPRADRAFNCPVNGMTVMGEPGAVERFKRTWRFYVNASNQTGVPTQIDIDIQRMQRNHPDLGWANLLVWVHVDTDTGGQWIVTNLDPNDQWVLAQVHYVNINMRSMMEEPLPFTATIIPSAQKTFLEDVEYYTFDEKVIVPGNSIVAETVDA